MRVIVAGSRTVKDKHLVWGAVASSGFNPSVVVSGGQRSFDKVSKTYYGCDYFGELLAESRDLELKTFPADWDGLGRKAGPIRNKEMAKFADALVAVWDGTSRGTLDMIVQAKFYGKPVFLRLLKSNGSGHIDVLWRPKGSKMSPHVITAEDATYVRKHTPGLGIVQSQSI